PCLISIDVFSHAISYRFKMPIDAPAALTTAIASAPDAIVLKGEPSSLSLSVTMRKEADKASTQPGDQATGSRSFPPLMVAFLVAALFSVLAGGGSPGSAWIFVNRTSLHPLYAARLIRAYLGASNNLRYGSKVPGVTDPVEGDDIAQEDYWRPKGNAFWKKGAPLHLINVTVNETIDGRSQTEQRDRKGVGMAIGPAGFSLGVQHHVVIKPPPPPEGQPQPHKIYPEEKDGFRVFDTKKGTDDFDGEKLSLGKWTAISGAAVSTG